MYRSVGGVMRQDDSDEEGPLCEGCQSERKVETYKNSKTADGARDVDLCEVCACTQAGNTLAMWPGQCDLYARKVMMVVVQATNMVLDRIDVLEAQVAEEEVR